MIDVIKEYLVSVGFQVDGNSVNKAKKDLNSVEKMVSHVKDGIANNKQIQAFNKAIEGLVGQLGPKLEAVLAETTLGLAAVGVAVAALTAAVGIGLVVAFEKFSESITKADMDVQIFARRMFTTVENARSLKAVMQAMGLKSLDDLNDVALNPELRAQFLELRKLAGSLSLNADQRQGISNLRAFTFEFQKLNVLMSYFWTMFGAETGKLLAGPLKGITKFMDRLGTGFMKELPTLAHSLATILSIVARIAIIFTKLVVRLTGGSPLKGWARDLDIFNKFLDRIDKILDAAGQFIDSLSFSKAWKFLTGQGGKKASGIAQSGGQLGKSVLELFTGQPASASADGIVGPHLLWANHDKSSKAINAYLAGLDPRLNELFRITAGKTNVGHASHGSGLAFDIGLAGKSDASILSILRASFATPGFKSADLELTPAHYSRVLGELRSQGIDPNNPNTRVFNQPSRFTTGENLHTNLKPVVQNVSISINGAHDPMTTAHTVKKVLGDQVGLALHALNNSYA